jgi:uncharacterized membrane protein YfcA
VSSPADLLLLFGAGILAGIVSVVASLASLVSYPALLALGLPPVSANVTNTVALMFTGLGATIGSRPELAGQGRRVLRLGLVTAVGGGVGAALLLLTPASGFEYAAPVLIAAGSATILRAPVPATLTAPEVSREHGWLPRIALFTVAVYVGYFGAAGGILLLAVLIRLLQQSLARTNAVKNAISGLANGVAGLGFAIFGPVRWVAVLPLAAGFLIGGWTGPKIVRRLPSRALRIFVGCCGLGLACWLGARTYL